MHFVLYDSFFLQEKEEQHITAPNARGGEISFASDVTATGEE